MKAIAVAALVAVGGITTASAPESSVPGVSVSQLAPMCTARGATVIRLEAANGTDSVQRFAFNAVDYVDRQGWERYEEVWKVQPHRSTVYEYRVPIGHSLDFTATHDRKVLAFGKPRALECGLPN